MLGHTSSVLAEPDGKRQEAETAGLGETRSVSDVGHVAVDVVHAVGRDYDANGSGCALWKAVWQNGLSPLMPRITAPRLVNSPAA
jgi:hypothetical protein